MTEQEISVKLTETEQRAKSNTHRIEKLEPVSYTHLTLPTRCSV